MNYVLRDGATGKYLRRVGLWVDGIDEAIGFDDLIEAREYCQAHQLTGLQPVQRVQLHLRLLMQALAGRL